MLQHQSLRQTDLACKIEVQKHSVSDWYREDICHPLLYWEKEWVKWDGIMLSLNIGAKKWESSFTDLRSISLEFDWMKSMIEWRKKEVKQFVWLKWAAMPSPAFSCKSPCVSVRVLCFLFPVWENVIQNDLPPQNDQSKCHFVFRCCYCQWFLYFVPFCHVFARSFSDTQVRRRQEHS
jgi:hypothetical protein